MFTVSANAPMVSVLGWKEIQGDCISNRVFENPGLVSRLQAATARKHAKAWTPSTVGRWAIRVELGFQTRSNRVHASQSQRD